MFIVFEGGEGCGKTTLINMVHDFYKDSKNVIKTKEPGGTIVGNKIRELLLSDDCENINLKSEALLYAASRGEFLEKVILPNRNNFILADRFKLSSVVYQGIVGGLGEDYIERINSFDTIEPDITIYLDIDPGEAQQRIKRRLDYNRFDRRDIEFHKNIRDGYSTIMRKRMSEEPNKFFIVDASQSINNVFNDIIKILEERV